MNSREERIRSKAYELWEKSGRPEGEEAAHWAEAERLIDAEDGAVTERRTDSEDDTRIASAGVNPGETGPAQPDEVETVEAEVPVRRKRKASVKPRRMPGA